MKNKREFPVYSEPLYRPPSEAYSLILQITSGCSHNKCSFCRMYKSKKYYVKNFEEIKNEIDIFRENLSFVKRIFLADGDAISIPTELMIKILQYIKIKFPECERVSSYASPKSILEKTDEELDLIRKNGLDLIYLGIESGDTKVLKQIRKDVDYEEMLTVCKRIKKAGFKLSATLIAGITGTEDFTDHAVNSGKLISEAKPDYLGVLTLLIDPGCEIYNLLRQGKFHEADSVTILREIKTLLENINSDENIVFRANHASNYINLGGTLPEDKDLLLKEVNRALVELNFKDDIYRRL
ncbi:radical SAM protein [Fusobacterium sp.]|uniref:radical SAM protein n=1 Tax=Fusobacterium sp. TaxID=68766 RepID=UPI00396C827C